MRVDAKRTSKTARTISNTPNQLSGGCPLVDQSEYHRKDQTLESSLTVGGEISYASTALKVALEYRVSRGE